MRDLSRNPIRVGIDATLMLVAQRTGMEKYATALIGELAALHPDLRDIHLHVYLHAGNQYASTTYCDEAVTLLTRQGVFHRVHHLRRGYGLALSAFALQDRVEMLHVLRIGRPWFHTCPGILTIYDLKAVGLSDEGRCIERADLGETEIRTVEQAAGIISISNSTLHDLQETFGDGIATKTRVVHLGVDPAYFTATPKDAQERNPWGRYIFFVGTLQYRKNLPRLIEAYALVKQTHGIPHKLVLAGRDGWGAELVYAAVKQHGVEGEVIFPGYISEADLPGIYARADVFAYPSLHEGFGIPLLEAMASGTVVLTSPLFSIPEVAGDAAVYVDPYDVNDMAAGIWRALSDEALRADLLARGKQRARQFTWRAAATQTLQAYRDFFATRVASHDAKS